jgi:Fic family protein
MSQDAAVRLTAWPPHTAEVRPWRQSARSGTRADRTLTRVSTRRPPLIGGIEVDLDADLGSHLEAATSQIVALDGSRSAELEALGTLLLRTESVASSKIESVEAATADYARALHGSRANASAVAMVAATRALEVLMHSVRAGAPIRLSHLLDAHRSLMRDDAAEGTYAGRLRDVQNWIGGSDHSPREALYVPPAPELVAPLMDDLLAFAGRDDLPVLAQAAIAHAQFESVHPFTDGNGRIGRALMNVILRRRGTTRRVVVPLASALVARRDNYFELLDRYREGDARPVVAMVADSAKIAATEAGRTGERLALLPDEWEALLGRSRRGSADQLLLASLTSRPVFSAEDVVAAIDGPQSSVYAAISRLAEAGVVRPLFERVRSQVWAVGAVLDELDDLNARIARAARPARSRPDGVPAATMGP